MELSSLEQKMYAVAKDIGEAGDNLVITKSYKDRFNRAAVHIMATVDGLRITEIIPTRNKLRETDLSFVFSAVGSVDPEAVIPIGSLIKTYFGVGILSQLSFNHSNTVGAHIILLKDGNRTNDTPMEIISHPRGVKVKELLRIVANRVQGV